MGVCLVNADYNIVSKNFLFNSSISLNEDSNMNNLRDNTLEEESISLSYSGYNTISENSLFNGSISMGESSRNNLTDNTIENGSIQLAVWRSLNLISKIYMDTYAMGLNPYNVFLGKTVVIRNCLPFQNEK